jgi:hypothetical protein
MKNIILSIVLFTSLNAGSQGEIEVFNILSGNLKKNMAKQVPIAEKYNYEFVNKKNKVKFTKIQNIELFRVIQLYNLKEYSAAKIVLNNMIKPIDTKYIKLFDILFSIEIKLANNQSIDNELESILNFGEYDLFFIKKVVIILNRYSLYKEGIFLLQNIQSVENIFVNSVELKYTKNKNISEDFEYYINIKHPLKNTKNALGYFYEQDNMLLEAYETYIENNIEKKNNIKIAALKEQIKFRVKKYHTEQYDTNVVDIKEKISNTKDFIIYKIFTEEQK